MRRVEKGEWKGQQRKPFRCRLRICSSGFQNNPKKTKQEGEMKNKENFMRRKDFVLSMRGPEEKEGGE